MMSIIIIILLLYEASSCKNVVYIGHTSGQVDVVSVFDAQIKIVCAAIHEIISNFFLFDFVNLLLYKNRKKMKL